MTGYCPKCGAECHAVLVNGRGYCERHGWVFVNWNPPNPRKDDHALPASHRTHQP